jgi:hypothetical protein
MNEKPIDTISCRIGPQELELIVQYSGTEHEISIFKVIQIASLKKKSLYKT